MKLVFGRIWSSWIENVWTLMILHTNRITLSIAYVLEPKIFLSASPTRSANSRYYNESTIIYHLCFKRNNTEKTLPVAWRLSPVTAWSWACQNKSVLGITGVVTKWLQEIGVWIVKSWCNLFLLKLNFESHTLKPLFKVNDYVTRILTFSFLQWSNLSWYNIRCGMLRLFCWIQVRSETKPKWLHE